MEAQINFIHADEFDLKIGYEMKRWLSIVIQMHKYNYSEINYTFCTDAELLEINKNYLQHDFYTDIITFDNTIHDMISADIFVSVERVQDNALQQGVDVMNELMRVLAHGILHCMGYKDNDHESKAVMRAQEEKALEMFHVEQQRKIDNV